MEMPNIMRKTILTFLSVLLITTSFGQNWLDVGVKGGYGLTLLFNQNIFDDASYNHQLSTGYTFGGKFGYNFGELHEVTFDVMSSSFNQKFKFNVMDSLSGATPEYQSSVAYRALDLFLMYRNNNSGRYFEIGPMISLIRNATHTNEFLEVSNSDASPNWAKNGYGISMGFGAYMIGTENFGVTFGARFNYMISDALSATGQYYNYPTNKTYESYKASHPFSAMVVMEMNYDLGYLAQGKCSKRRKILLF